MWTFHSNFGRSGWIFSSYVFFHLKKNEEICVESSQKTNQQLVEILWKNFGQVTLTLLGDFVAIVHFVIIFSYYNIHIQYLVKSNPFVGGQHLSVSRFYLPKGNLLFTLNAITPFISYALCKNSCILGILKRVYRLLNKQPLPRPT